MGRAETRMALQRGPELRQGPRSLSLLINVGCPGQCITCSEAPPFSQGQFLRKASSAINQEATLLEAGKMSACVLEGGSGCISALCTRQWSLAQGHADSKWQRVGPEPHHPHSRLFTLKAHAEFTYLQRFSQVLELFQTSLAMGWIFVSHQNPYVDILAPNVMY